MVSLAEAQQELQMLQKQLGESEHFWLHLCACKWQPHLCCSAWLWLDDRGLKNNMGDAFPMDNGGRAPLAFLETYLL